MTQPSLQYTLWTFGGDSAFYWFAYNCMQPSVYLELKFTKRIKRWMNTTLKKKKYTQLQIQIQQQPPRNNLDQL